MHSFDFLLAHHCRNADDILYVFDCVGNVSELLKFINNFHPNIILFILYLDD